MARIAVLALFFVFLTAFTAPVAKCQSTLEIKLIVDSLRHDGIRMVDERSHHVVFVRAKPFFNISDVDSANLYIGSEADGNPLYGVNIQFKPSLNDSMKSLTGRLIGRQLAIIVDGEILATPKILDPIQTAHVGLFVTTEAEAAELAKKIARAIGKR